MKFSQGESLDRAEAPLVGSVRLSSRTSAWPREILA